MSGERPRPELAVLVGLPGAGKTTFVRARLAGHVHVSKDLMGSARDRNARQLSLISRALAAAQSAVVDNTNLKVADRAPLIAAAHAAGAKVTGYLFDATARECLARNRTRGRRERRSRQPSASPSSTSAPDRFGFATASGAPRDWPWPSTSPSEPAFNTLSGSCSERCRCCAPTRWAQAGRSAARGPRRLRR